MDNKKKVHFFTIMTYMTFYILLGICGFLMLLGVSLDAIAKYAPIICSWSSFLVLMLWGKKLLSEKNRMEFLKNLFKDKISCRWIMYSATIPILIFIVNVLALSKMIHKPIGELVDNNYASYPLIFLSNLIAGPTGEEVGWRGYFFTKISERRGVLKGSLLTGLTWGLWHTPLWLMEGFTSDKFVVYVISFMVAISSMSVIMGYLYSRKRNLLYCIIIHQLFNFGAGILNIEQNEMIIYVILSACGYALSALLIVLISKRKK